MMLRFRFSAEEHHKLAFWLIAGVALAQAILVVLVIYELSTVTPEDVGAFAGRIVSGFNGAVK